MQFVSELRVNKYRDILGDYIITNPFSSFGKSMRSSSGAVLLNGSDISDMNNPLVRAAISYLFETNQMAVYGLFNAGGRRDAFRAYHASTWTGKEMLRELVVDFSLLREQSDWLLGADSLA